MFFEKNRRWKDQKLSGNKNSKIMPNNSELIEVSSSSLFDKGQYKITEPEKNITLSATYLHNRKASIANTSAGNMQTTSSNITLLSDTTPQ